MAGLSLRRRFAVAVLVAALLAALVFRSWIVAQIDAAIVVAAVADAPVLTDAVSALSREPREVDTTIAGVPTTVVRPRRGGPWPTVVFVNGVTRRGRAHPTVRRLARAFGRSGYATLVPDPPGLTRGELTPRTVEAVVRVAVAATRRRDAERGRIAFIGVSAGGSLALLAAADPRLCARVSIVSAVAPYTDLRDVVRLATTGFHGEQGTLLRYEVRPFVTLVAARSLAAALPEARGRRELLADLRAIADADAAARTRVRASGLRARGPARALVALLRNRDPRRFDALFAALPASVRASIRQLSPIHRARAVCAPVELVSAPHDKYFPPAESRAFVSRARDARLTISETLQHADLELSLGQLADFARLDAFVVRSLRRAR